MIFHNVIKIYHFKFYDTVFRIDKYLGRLRNGIIHLRWRDYFYNAGHELTDVVYRPHDSGKTNFLNADFKSLLLCYRENTSSLPTTYCAGKK